MRSFIFHNPTKIIFGNGSVDQLGENARMMGKKALLVYGRNSIKESGLFDRVVKQLGDNRIGYIEHGGVKANPSLAHAREGVRKAVENKVDFILAVGGGSVIDTAKAIAASAATGQDIWKFFTLERPITAALPIMTVLTLPATASEMNGNAVISNEETKEKLGLGSPFLYPKISILDPALTYSVPLKYTAYASVDMISHLTESYFNNDGGWTRLQEYYVEGLVKTIMEATDRVMKNPQDADGRATLMWAATLAWNGLNTAGVGAAGTPCHKLEHPISALYDIAHGAGLSIITPAWLRGHINDKTLKLARFGREIFKITTEDDRQAALEAIEQLENWYRRIGAPVTFKEAGIENPDIAKMTELTVKSAELTNTPGLPAEFVEKVYNCCC